ncbi:MAG: hypothetical protein IKI45_10445 [Oscillospiraceae bacterium]|nr:hypothetical protein [Oscillospiraceae bacterium]
MKRAAKIAIIGASAFSAVAGIIVAAKVLLSGFSDSNGGKPISEDLKCNITDTAKCGEWYGLLASTNLYTFPEEIPSGASDTEYRFRLDNNFFEPSSLVYLKCTYDADTYQTEVERLADIKGIQIDEEHYNGTAYVAMLRERETEYALLIDEKTIVYICYADGLFPKHPDKEYMRKESEKKDSFSLKDVKNLDQYAQQSAENNKSFSIYEGMRSSELKYWPKSWTF